MIARYHDRLMTHGIPSGTENLVSLLKALVSRADAQNFLDTVEISYENTCRNCLKTADKE